MSNVDDEEPVFDQVDEYGVPNEEGPDLQEWLAANPLPTTPGPPTDGAEDEKLTIDPYDESIPVSQRIGTQHLYGADWEAAKEAARAYQPPGTRPPEPEPKRGRLVYLWHLMQGLKFSKRVKSPGVPDRPALQVVPPAPEQRPGKPRLDRRELVASGMEVVGIAGVSVGSGMIYHPAGVIVGGLGLVLLGVATGR